jgi:septal ring factor EnvC (AmiA/AmiB activator)
MSDPNWFQKKWGFPNPTPGDLLYQKLEELEEKYNALLLDVKRLEEENIETANTLYEIMNSIEAVDARIDILVENTEINKNV